MIEDAGIVADDYVLIHKPQAVQGSSTQHGEQSTFVTRSGYLRRMSQALIMS